MRKAGPCTPGLENFQSVNAIGNGGDQETVADADGEPLARLMPAGQLVVPVVPVVSPARSCVRERHDRVC